MIISGFITGMFVKDYGFVFLMLFTGIIIEVGKYYLVEKTSQVSTLLSAYFIAVIVSYFVATRCKNSFLSKMFTICFLIGVFVLGAKGFFYLFYVIRTMFLFSLRTILENNIGG